MRFETQKLDRAEDTLDELFKYFRDLGRKVAHLDDTEEGEVEALHQVSRLYQGKTQPKQQQKHTHSKGNGEKLPRCN